MRACAPAPQRAFGVVELPSLELRPYSPRLMLTAPLSFPPGVYISNRASDKITAVDDRIYCCRSGSAADTQAVSDYVKYFLDQHRMEYGKPPKVETAANLVLALAQRRLYASRGNSGGVPREDQNMLN